MDINQMDEEARKAGFLVAAYGTGELYFRQLTPTIAIFVEREKDNRYICYRLKWEYEPDADGMQKIKDEKFYCRGNLRRCLNKAKSIVDFWETKIFKKNRGGKS